MKIDEMISPPWKLTTADKVHDARLRRLEEHAPSKAIFERPCFAVPPERGEKFSFRIDGRRLGFIVVAADRRRIIWLRLDRDEYWRSPLDGEMSFFRTVDDHEQRVSRRRYRRAAAREWDKLQHGASYHVRVARSDVTQLRHKLKRKRRVAEIEALA